MNPARTPFGCSNLHVTQPCVSPSFSACYTIFQGIDTITRLPSLSLSWSLLLSPLVHPFFIPSPPSPFLPSSIACFYFSWCLLHIFPSRNSLVFLNALTFLSHEPFPLFCSYTARFFFFSHFSSYLKCSSTPSKFKWINNLT